METKLRNPYQRALVTMAGLVGFSLLATLAGAGLSSAGVGNPALTWIGLTFLTILSLIWVIVWGLGGHQRRRARAFLESDRPLVRWTYSAAEWQQIREAAWQEESNDWKIQWGCLTLLLALAGSLTGAMLGLEGDFVDFIGNGLIGLALGGLAGAVTGGLVAGGNFLGARQAYTQSEPGQAALGPNEIYLSDDYFKGDGVNSAIQGIALQRGSPTTLKIQILFPPRPRMPREEEWVIVVPGQWIDRVEETLPALTPNGS